MKKNLVFNIVAIFLIVVLCFSISPITLQNDTFYTIKIGEHIMNYGVDMVDPFSIHSLVYTYPHWLYDVFIYLVYNAGGFLGVHISTIVLCCILGISLYLTNIKLTKNNIISLAITLISMYLLSPFIAARAQLVTFILFVFTIYFIEQFLRCKKKRYAIGLVIIPAVVANVHAAIFPFYFVLYLPYIVEYIIWLFLNRKNIRIKKLIAKKNKQLKNANNDDVLLLKSQILELEEKKEYLLKKRRINEDKTYKILIKKNNNMKSLIIILIIGLFAGMLTPLGLEPYTHYIRLSQGNTLGNITEHLPIVLAYDTNFISLLILFLGMLIFTDVKIRLCDLFMLGGLLVLAICSQRQTSMFILIGTFILIRLLCQFYDRHEPTFCEKVKTKMLKPIGILITFVLIIGLSVGIYFPKINEKFIDEQIYPVEASGYILENLDISNIRIYNSYNYGSYLLFKGIPVFVDSRADLYTPEFNKGSDVFSDFLDITDAYTEVEEREAIFDKYQITHLVLHKDELLRIFVKNDTEIYQEIYGDDSFFIYKRDKLTKNG